MRSRQRQSEATDTRLRIRKNAISKFQQKNDQNGVLIRTHRTWAWPVPKNLTKLPCYLLRIDIKLCLSPNWMDKTIGVVVALPGTGICNLTARWGWA
jgi:hypothetical protein